MFTSTKRFGPISTGHRQWRDDGHCSRIHGYGRIVEIEFGCHELDDRGWVQDFGGLKTVNEWLHLMWDHRVLVAEDDPHLGELRKMDSLGLIKINVLKAPYGPSIEQGARHVFDHVNEWVEAESQGRVWVQSVRVWEHENNAAKYTRPSAPPPRR